MLHDERCVVVGIVQREMRALKHTVAQAWSNPCEGNDDVAQSLNVQDVVFGIGVHDHVNWCEVGGRGLSVREECEGIAQV